MEDDLRTLTELNARFLGACVVGSLDELDAVLDPSFVYVDTYRRVDGRWTCVHGCLCPLPPAG